MALLRFLWEQVKWAAAVGTAVGAAYVAYRTRLPWWVSSILLWVGILIIVGWALRLLSMLFGSDGDHHKPQYDDKPKKRQTWREREEEAWQEMHDAHQREEEDRWS